MKTKQIIFYKSSPRVGISLITLVITIIVIIILAGVIILSLANNNVLESANEATFKNDLDSFRNELLLYNTNQYTNTAGVYNQKSLQADTYEIVEIIESLRDNKKYEGKLAIIDGELVFICTGTIEDEWAEEIGIRVSCLESDIAISAPVPKKVTNLDIDARFVVRITSSYDIDDVDTSKIEAYKVRSGSESADTKIDGVLSFDKTNIKAVKVTFETSSLVNGQYYYIVVPKDTVTTIVEGEQVKNKERTTSESFEIDISAVIAPIIEVENEYEWTISKNVSITYHTGSVGKKYSTDGGNIWNDYTGPFVVNTNNTTILAYATNNVGTRSETESYTITKIDNIVPQNANIDVRIRESNIEGALTYIDNESGINMSQSKYVITTNSTKYDINDSVWNTAQTISENPQSISVAKSSGDWYVHTLSVDNVGNKNTNISDKIELSTINYGTEIQDVYEDIYLSDNPQVPFSRHTSNLDDYYNGNYRLSSSLLDRIIQIGSTELTTKGNTRGAYVNAGQNTINLKRESNLNRWICVKIYAGGWTTSVSVSNVRLRFADGSTYTPQAAIENGYIEPLVIMTAGSHGTSYVWGNFINLKNGGSTNTKSFPTGVIIFKVKEKSPLKSFLINSSKDFDKTYDYIRINEAVASVEISTTPF